MTAREAGGAPIPAFTLDRQLAAMGAEIEAAVAAVVRSGRYILGRPVEELERAMAAYLGVAHAVGVGNGSDALYLALKAVGVGAGDEVITTPFTFFATAGSIVRAGAKPVFSDIDPDTFNLDTGRALDRVTPRTRAILPVHLFGLMADWRPLAGQPLAVVEDVAQALGARREGRMAGTVGQVAAFSFFPTKNLGALGDGGLVATNDPRLAARVAALRAHGAREKYRHELADGINSRLDALQAAALAVKLPRLEGWNARRRALAARYREGLAAAAAYGVVVPVEPPGCYHVYHQFTIRAPRRDALQRFLAERAIGSTVYYPVPLHLQPALAHLGHRPGDFPAAEAAAASVLSLPMFPELTEEEVDRVVEAVLAFYRRG